MKPGFFKSATALAVIASLAAPMPGVAQTEGDATFDLSKMSETEIAALVDRVSPIDGQHGVPRG